MDRKLLNLNIMESLSRCNKFGINEEQLYSKKILDGVELQERFAQNRDLILTASPYMEKLINFVKGSNFFALLTDGKGCILNAIGDEGILSEAFSMRMIPGAFMNEKSIGTNAMSMVLNYKKPVQVSGEEHFIKAYHKWTCSAAPIMDDNNNILGVLNLTGYIEQVHPHTLGMVVAASSAIEQMLKVKKYNRLDNIVNSHIKNVFESIPVVILTSDMDGKIKLYNKRALRVFENYDNKLKAKDMNEIIVDWYKIKDYLYTNKKSSFQVTIFTFGNKLSCNVTASPIYDPQINDIEMVYAFQEIHKVKNKKSNGQAYYTFDKIIGEDDNFIKVVQYAKKISDSKSTILIMGESGTGKEVFAQSIHNYSSRMDGPFIALNCGAIPKQLIESELFGYEEGAFTGARKGGNIGKFELANGGTIMLDEIGEMPLDMQTKLLRVVQEGTITRIGSSKSIYVDVRIIAATNKDLKGEVEIGTFRKDLYYRLNVLPIYLPPLRKRKGDIILLLKYFMKNIADRLNKKQVDIPEEYLKKMLNYDWPGNIRELENVVELIINTESLPGNYFGEEESHEDNILIDLNKENLKLDHIEKMHIIKTLKKFKGNVTHTADALGIGRNTLYNKMKKYDIEIHIKD